MTFKTGEQVQTPLGKGVVRAVRNNGRILVEVRGRGLLFAQTEVSAIRSVKPQRGHRARPPGGGADADTGREMEVDLHGMTVAEALAAVERALNDALLGGHARLRLIHGRSGGRIRGAVHGWLRGVSAVRRAALDPRNEGVTVVEL